MQRVRVTAANAPTFHPLLQRVPPARTEAATDCDSRVLVRRLRALPRTHALQLLHLGAGVGPFLPLTRHNRPDPDVS